ncbi:uncharacterized, partial [Tachysurus ichikawai]
GVSQRTCLMRVGMRAREASLLMDVTLTRAETAAVTRWHLSPSAPVMQIARALITD